MLTDGAQFLQASRPRFLEFHPRVYCRQKLTDKQAMIVALATSENDYTCGSLFTTPRPNHVPEFDFY